MDTVSQMESMLREVLGERADVLARECGFIVRQRAFSGSDFVQGLVFGWLKHPDARVVQLVRSLRRRHVQITPSGLCQRFTEEASIFLRRVLQELIAHVVVGPTVDNALLQRFSSVILEDSTSVCFPDALQEIWRGCGGGNNQTRAAVKLHVQFNLVNGALQGPALTDGRTADQRSPLRQAGIAPGQLYITDEGYFGLEWLKTQTAEGDRFFLTRPRSVTVFLDRQGQRLNLLQIGPQQQGQWLDLPVLVGAKVRLPARLIMLRVPQEVVEQRQERMRETAARHGSVASPEQLALAQWTILITNVDPERLSVDQVIVLQRARWQIERLFRLWKQDLQIDEWRTRNPWRILCEFYAKVMAAVIEHWIVIGQCWRNPARSLVKAAVVVRDHADRLLAALCGRACWSEVIAEIAQDIGAECQVDRRRKRPALVQLLQTELAWCLT